jgi:hypothetical protein
MSKFVTGATVFGSALSLDKNAKLDHALVEGKVLSIQGRSAEVEFQNGIGVKTVGTVRLHSNVSFLLVEFGDFQNETVNLDPLANSIHAFLRLLISDDSLIKFIKLRSEDELEYALKHYGGYSHIILVGHGSAAGQLCVGDDKKISSAKFANLVAEHCSSQPTLISMCCHSGEAAFAKKISAKAECGAVIAPKGAIHSCSASQFVQSFLGFQILEGMRLKSAFDKARECTPGSACLRIWKDGTIQ